MGMAVIADYTISEGPAKGARIIIDDACYRGISAEELERRRLEVAREIRKIDMEAQTRERAGT